MVIQQTIEIPANHHLTIEVPREIPAGKAILTFAPAPASPEKNIDKEALSIAHGFVEQHIVAFKDLAK
jgi:hypothetical protein